MSSPYYNHPYWPSPRAARIAKLLLKKHEMPRNMGWIFEQAWTAAGHPVKPEGRLTHDKALKVMADYLRLTVHEFLHIKPFDAILRLKLANTEEKAWRILGNTTLSVWWGGRMPCCVVCDRMPPAPAPAQLPPEGAAAGPLASEALPNGGLATESLAAASPAPAEPPVAATVVPVREPIADIYKDDPCTCRVLGRTCECDHDAATLSKMVPAPGPAPAASGELIETLMEFLKEMNGSVTPADQRYVKSMVLRYKGRVL